MRKPHLKDWYFIRMSDGHPYDKLPGVKAIFNEIQEKGEFDALHVTGGLGIVGKRKIDELDSDHVMLKVLRLKKCHDGILVTTERYAELLIAEDDMKHMFKIFRESRKLAEAAAKRAAIAEGEVLKARAEKKAAEKLIPETESPPTSFTEKNIPQSFLGRVASL